MGKGFLMGTGGSGSSKPKTITYSSSGQLQRIIQGDVFTIPISSEGIFASTTFQPEGNTVFNNASQDPIVTYLQFYRKIIIPEYFANMNFTFSGGSNSFNHIEEIEWLGNGSWTQLTSMNNLYQNQNLVTISAPNYTGTVTYGINNGRYFNLKMPNATVFYTSRSYSGSYSYLGPDSDLSGVITIGNNRAGYYYGPTEGLYGTYTFPSCTELINMPKSGSNSVDPLTLYLPQLTTFTNYFSSSTNYTGYTNLYIGRSLSTVSATMVTSINTYIANGTLTIHIPAGVSGTKQTLDNAGITSYIQDYDPEA